MSLTAHMFGEVQLRCRADPELVALHPAGAGAAPAAYLQLHVGAQDAWPTVVAMQRAIKQPWLIG